MINFKINFRSRKFLIKDFEKISSLQNFTGAGNFFPSLKASRIFTIGRRTEDNPNELIPSIEIKNVLAVANANG